MNFSNTVVGNRVQNSKINSRKMDFQIVQIVFHSIVIRFKMEKINFGSIHAHSFLFSIFHSTFS